MKRENALAIGDGEFCCPIVLPVELIWSASKDRVVCGKKLTYFKGVESLGEYLYCQKHGDVAYSPEDGTVIGLIE